MRTVTQEEFERLLTPACVWARDQEEHILAHGTPLTDRQATDASRAGVQYPSRVRILVVDRIPLPEDEELARIARRTQLIRDTSRAATFGYGIMVCAKDWNDRELLLHQFVHVTQYERCGDLDAVIREFLLQRRECANFAVGGQDEEAQRIARAIVTSN